MRLSNRPLNGWALPHYEITIHLGVTNKEMDANLAFPELRNAELRDSTPTDYLDGRQTGLFTAFRLIEKWRIHSSISAIICSAADRRSSAAVIARPITM